MRRTSLTLLVLLALFGAACGGDDGGDDPTIASPTGTTETPEPTDEPTATSEPTDECEDQTGEDQIELDMQDNFFEPDCLVVLASQPINIENQGAALHSFTIDGTQVDVDVQPDSEFNGEGNAVAPGEYEFRCKYHPGMEGTLTAE